MFESISNFSLYLRLSSVKRQLNVLQEAFTALRFRALSFWMWLHFTQPWLHTLISGTLAETAQIWSCWLAHENSIVAENNTVTAWAWSVNEHQIRLLFESFLHPGQIRGSRASGDKAESTEETKVLPMGWSSETHEGTRTFILPAPTAFSHWEKTQCGDILLYVYFSTLVISLPISWILSGIHLLEDLWTLFICCKLRVFPSLTCRYNLTYSSCSLVLPNPLELKSYVKKSHNNSELSFK